MAEVARVTGVSRQTLYELRGRYGDTADLGLAVLQAVITQYPATKSDLAAYLTRSEEEVEQVVTELEDGGLIAREEEFLAQAGWSEAPYAISQDGLRALETWSLEEGPSQRSDAE